MGLLSLFISNGGVSDEEIALAVPDAMEAKSLSHHTKRCALRYKLFTKRQAAVASQTGRVEMTLWAFGGYLVVVSEPARNLLHYFGLPI